MKNLLINFSERSPLADLLKSELSFQPFVEFIQEKLANDTTVKKEMLQFVQEGLKKFPSLDHPVKPEQLDDYIELIPSVEIDLQDTPDLLAFYQSLTPGYRKDWARYVYSAKQEATKTKRREEMKMILRGGFKSRDSYLREKNNKVL